MDKILIFSDTHNYIDPCIQIIKNTKDVKAIIHAGDCADDADDLKYIFPDIPVYNVRGNNDFLSSAPDKKLITISDKKILTVHGHIERVKYDLSLTALSELGEKYRADLVIFGHTHKPQTEYKNNMIIINPGSVRFSRTYAIAEFDGDIIKTSILDI